LSSRPKRRDLQFAFMERRNLSGDSPMVQFC
jgi:hypothetical protein